MILFFGPPGSGKSVQGQMLAARRGWRWISGGQLLRDTHDIDILRTINSGNLVDSDQMNKIIADALQRATDIEHVILDGYPRTLDQAQWLTENLPEHERSVSLVILLVVPKYEIDRRIELRGRLDDTTEAVNTRLETYRQATNLIINYFTDKQVPIAHVDADGTVDEVYDRIQTEINTVIGQK